MAGGDVPRHYRPDGQPGQDFDGAVGDPEVVAEAWATWRSEVAFAEEYVAAADDLGLVGAEGHFLRDILVHMIEAARTAATRTCYASASTAGSGSNPESDLTPESAPASFDLHRLQTVQIQKAVQTWVKRAQKPAAHSRPLYGQPGAVRQRVRGGLYRSPDHPEVPSLALVPRGSTACSTRSARRSTRPAAGDAGGPSPRTVIVGIMTDGPGERQPRVQLPVKQRGAGGRRGQSGRDRGLGRETADSSFVGVLDPSGAGSREGASSSESPTGPVSHSRTSPPSNTTPAEAVPSLTVRAGRSSDRPDRRDPWR